MRGLYVGDLGRGGRGSGLYCIGREGCVHLSDDFVFCLK